MESKAKIKSCGMDFDTEEVQITLAVSKEMADYCNQNKTKEMVVEIKPYSPKRSLNANAYCWVLIEQIAKVNHTSILDVYEQLLADYGTFDTFGVEPIQIKVKPYVDISVIEGHWVQVGKDTDDMDIYAKIKGSSEYTREEMAHFIDGVVYEAKELGIQTLTPNELHKIKEVWGVE